MEHESHPLTPTHGGVKIPKQKKQTGSKFGIKQMGTNWSEEIKIPRGNLDPKPSSQLHN